MLLAVRHHSPACARMVRDTIAQRQPAAVLIEGPADFNERLAELALPHRPPIAIYSYLAWEDGSRHGAYYPLCEHSPEWQALAAAAHIGAAVRFIDLPLALLAREDPRTHRYGDDRLRSSDYVAALCRKLGVESFDDAWDLIAEVDPELTVAELRQRIADFCRCLREADEGRVPPSELSRERFMAAHIRAAWQEHGRERVLVVTGGYHTSALERLLAENSASRPDDTGTQVTWPEGITERGIALTPYSYERLDSLGSYDAGMPSPGFYHQAWRAGDGREVHLPLLAAVIGRLRELKQTASTADLIGIESCARGLAALRGHRRVWRNDLTDGITSALVKDDLHVAHPFLLAMQQVLRGGERGQLAPGAPLPPLVRDIHQRLAAHGLTPSAEPLSRELTLTRAADMEASRLLHQLRVLGIPGFERVAGADFACRADLSELTEEWGVLWTPEQDAQLIEASRYGSALHEAAAARLAEGARGIERSAAAIALLLLDAVLAGVLSMAAALRERAVTVIDSDGDLGSIATAMDHLLYLYAWDDALGARGSLETGTLLAASFGRALWLLESGAPVQDATPSNAPGAQPASGGEVKAVRLLRDAFEKSHERMGLDREALCAALARVQADRQRGAPLRGACAGALWSLQSADPAAIRRDLMEFADSQALGDFLIGLFALAREQAQADEELLQAVRAVAAAWDEDSFLAALPAMRLAFMYFTAREKVYLARTLFAQEDAQGASELVPLTVSTAQAAQALAFERQLARLAAEYGVRIEALDE